MNIHTYINITKSTLLYSLSNAEQVSKMAALFQNLIFSEKYRTLDSQKCFFSVNVFFRFSAEGKPFEKRRDGYARI